MEQASSCGWKEHASRKRSVSGEKQRTEAPCKQLGFPKKKEGRADHVVFHPNLLVMPEAV